MNAINELSDRASLEVEFRGRLIDHARHQFIDRLVGLGLALYEESAVNLLKHLAFKRTSRRELRRATCEHCGNHDCGAFLGNPKARGRRVGHPLE